MIMRSSSVSCSVSRKGSFHRKSDIEHYALSQRQRTAEIDGIGGAAHIGAPGVRARFTATAGFLFATEGAADFSARGADIDVGDAAIRTGRRHKEFGFADIVGEDR